MKSLRRVYLLHTGNLHTLYRHLVKSPPVGYVIITKNYPGLNQFHQSDLLGTLAIRQFHGVPMKLLRSVMALLEPIPRSDLIFSDGLLNFKNRRWVIAVEEALSSFQGSSYDHKWTHPIVETSLSNPNCKAVIYCFEATKKSLRTIYNTIGFERKMVYVPPAVPVARRPELQMYSRTHSRTIKIVMLGSANFRSHWWFYGKGGHILLDAFSRLTRLFDNLQLIVLSAVPKELLGLTASNPRITVFDGPIFGDELEKVLWGSHICVLPSRVTPWTGFLEAMNHELPIVTVGMHANAEVVEDGVTGFVIDVGWERDRMVGNYAISSAAEFQSLRRNWLHDYKHISTGIVEATSRLIRDSQLRIEMGIEGRSRVLPGGKFSVQKRNLALKGVFDRALRD